MNQTRFLVLDRLESGDVLLTLPSDNDAKVIKALSGGSYSHAAIVLDKWEYLESTWDDDFSGVRGTLFHPKFTAFDGLRRVMVCDVSNYRLFDVFRYCPSSTSATEQFAKFKKGLAAQASRRRARPYASAHLLISALTRWSPLSRLLALAWTRRLAAWVMSKRLRPHKVEGEFCSMLVATLFHEAGLAIFPDVQVMPSQLAEKLTLVSDNVVVDGVNLSGVTRMDESAEVVNNIVKLGSGVSQTWDEVVQQIVESTTRAATRWPRPR